MSLPEEQNWVFRLYIVSDAPNSRFAIANLNLICQEYLPGHFRFEIVDILLDPLRAIQDGV